METCFNFSCSEVEFTFLLQGICNYYLAEGQVNAFGL